MTIQVDTREKPKIIESILKEFDRQGVEHFSSKLFVGDYMNMDNPKLVIDRKHKRLLSFRQVNRLHGHLLSSVRKRFHLADIR